MSRKFYLLNPLIIAVMLLGFPLPLMNNIQRAQAAAAAQPVVAIHVSELTQALASMPATGPVPTGSDYSGYAWFYTSWNYATIYESLKIALESDGTPYQVVTDADIAGGALLAGNLPKYPILFSLASEAVADNEIQPLRDYVAAGGFLFVGSSAFTRKPDGTSRGDFALADEMGLKMATHSLQNWVSNAYFTHWGSHRLVAHIPVGTLGWNMLSQADEVVWNTSGAQQLWRTAARGAEVIATGCDQPLLATHGYGAGRIIYHAILNPIVGAGGQDSGMYAYTIYRSAIEWAFESAGVPLIKRSPWPYAYNAAFMVRHDFENLLSLVMDIENSARYEHSIGVKGDYYFSTGILRTMKDTARLPVVESLRRAVTNFRATIGPHNGGYPNPVVSNPGYYEYWHWGPDTLLDRTHFEAPYQGYTNGYDYARDSIRISFEDIETWLNKTDNGRDGCGEAGSCPRTWVSPFFNSGRDRSLKILTELGSVAMGEQKLSPFPHWTLSYDPATSGQRYPTLALPVSDWYVASNVAQSIESGHTPLTIQALVDFYYQKGYLINLYGHTGSESGLMKAYASYAAQKPRVWSTNTVGLYDWWLKRDQILVTPQFSRSGDTAVASASINGTGDPQAAVELSLPNWNSSAPLNLEVWLNGVPAQAGEYRLTNYGVKVRVGPGVSQVEVRYPLPAARTTQRSHNPAAQQPGPGRQVVASPKPTLFRESFAEVISEIPGDRKAPAAGNEVVMAHLGAGPLHGAACK